MAEKFRDSKPPVLRLNYATFKNAKEQRAAEKRVRTDEWELMERARLRKAYFAKPEYRSIIAPLLNGFEASIVGPMVASAVRVHLSPEDKVRIDVLNTIKRSEESPIIEHLVKSITESFMSGYFTALGLKERTSANRKITPPK